MHEEYFVLIEHVGLNHHFDRERFIGKATADLGLGIGISRAVEMDSRRGGESEVVGDTKNLEVIILIEVVSGNRLIEAEQ